MNIKVNLTKNFSNDCLQGSKSRFIIANERQSATSAWRVPPAQLLQPSVCTISYPSSVCSSTVRLLSRPTNNIISQIRWLTLLWGLRFLYSSVPIAQETCPLALRQYSIIRQKIEKLIMSSYNWMGLLGRAVSGRWSSLQYSTRGLSLPGLVAQCNYWVLLFLSIHSKG